MVIIETCSQALHLCLQILWVETQPASHGWTGRAKALRDRLLGAAAGVLGALNSRNCRRPFAPATAFQTEDLPPARFHAEVRAAAASLGGLMEARHTRVWAVLTCVPTMPPGLQSCFQKSCHPSGVALRADRPSRQSMPCYKSCRAGECYRTAVPLILFMLVVSKSREWALKHCTCCGVYGNPHQLL